MENLHIDKDQKTPLIEFNFKGELRIEGRSLPENPMEFYQTTFVWLKTFVESKPNVINLHVNLEHFNTASSKILLNIFKLFEPLHMRGSKVNIYWYYLDDSDMQEAGQDYAEIIKYPFHFVKIPQ